MFKIKNKGSRAMGRCRFIARVPSKYFPAQSQQTTETLQ